MYNVCNPESSTAGMVTMAKGQILLCKFTETG